MDGILWCCRSCPAKQLGHLAREKEREGTAGDSSLELPSCVETGVVCFEQWILKVFNDVYRMLDDDMG